MSASDLLQASFQFTVSGRNPIHHLVMIAYLEWLISIWVNFYLLSSANQYMINQKSQHLDVSDQFFFLFIKTGILIIGCTHPSMCLMIIYVIIMARLV